MDKTKKLPTPKQGKKDVQIGCPVVERQRTPRIENPLTKAIRVANFHPSVTTDQVEKYIVENTTVTDRTKFKCTKLVKKDADLTQFTYVSFKIDVTPEAYDILKEPENWPKSNTVRDFEKLSPTKPTLNDFMSQKEAPSNQQVVGDGMEITNDLLGNDGEGSGNGNGNSSNSILQTPSSSSASKN